MDALSAKRFVWDAILVIASTMPFIRSTASLVALILSDMPFIALFIAGAGTVLAVMTLIKNRGREGR